MGLSIDTANKIFALEGVLRANPSLLQTLMGAGFDLGGIVDGFAGSGQELADHAVMEEEQMAERHGEEGNTQMQMDDGQTHPEEQPEPEVPAITFPGQQTGGQSEEPPAEREAESQEGPGKDPSSVEEVTEQPSTANGVVSAYTANSELPAPMAGDIQAVAAQDQSDQSMQTASQDGSSTVPPANALISFPQSQPRDEQQQQQEQQEDYDTQQQAQQSQQADAAALIAQLSQSLLAQQSPQTQTPNNAVVPSSGFTPIISTGAGAAAAGTGFADENAGQGALLMDVLQHVSIVDEIK